ncbi:MAG: SDR family NAD(P)-dependent oxidoreductase [Cyclobacteriaceae bacterium]|nr:SDR family NAD(P)-dependent oxidoreductase [Cyclobacteriaceae bacterium]UYN85848.1 MAG: SDR family NAD(P)-dependent oxidoreductase [Cyclobacteriaceae bacterium]
MTDKNVIITGAGGNLGRVVVEKFLKANFTVIAILSEGKKLEHDFEGNIYYYAVDLTREKEVNALTDKIIETHGSIEIGILLAGGFSPGSLSETSDEVLKKMYSRNFETSYFIARNLHQHMMAQPNGGRMVLIGSKPSLNPKEAKGSVAYALAKSLLFRFAEILNAEGQAKGVVTSVVVPGTIDTPANRAAMPNANFSTWVSAEDIAYAIHYLCTEKGASLHDPVLKMYGIR